MDENRDGKPWLKQPLYMNPFYKNADISIVIHPTITNTMLKLRTNTYPFMPLLKYQKLELNLGNNCLMCNLDSLESLEHILFFCPRYERFRQQFKIPLNRSINELLSDRSLSEIHDFTSFNMITLFRLLEFRWVILNKIFDTMIAEHSSQLLMQQQSGLPDTCIPD